ncbi:Ficolin-1 [Mizuhopecten yessoensis]|uniref:Ficolin-1 n=1 Tax=Mizuhopecten yessoensis TaxID=6573 RepID=A0A210PP47_MIZYE|nr:Ficolin-1 [Mizuhopecten yessoensis]
MEDITGLSKYAAFTIFSDASESDNYTLTVSGFSGNIRNAMNEHNLQRFSNRDHDNDGATGNCAMSYQGGWWYNRCHRANLSVYTISRRRRCRHVEVPI